MIDIHTHILPGMDDGAKNAKEAMAMLSLLKKQGITLAVLTPHFYPQKESLAQFLKRRAASFQSIRDSKLDLLLASETALSESLFLYSSIDPLLIANKRYLMLELPFLENWGAGVFRQIDRLVNTYEVRPIIAHVERYAPVQHRKEKVLQELTDLGCLFQLNIDSVVNKKSQAFAIRLIKGDWIDFVGSDCHDLSERPPQFDAFKSVLEKKVGTEYIRGWDQPFLF